MMSVIESDSSLNKPKLVDIARLAGVSVSTASRALSGSKGVATGTIQQVREAALKVGYPLKRPRMSSTNTHTLGVLLANVASPFCAALIEAIEATALRRGYTIVLCNSAFQAKKQAESLQLLVQKRVDGLIIVPVETEAPQLAALVEDGLPIVQVDRYADGLRCDAVTSDNARGACQAVRFLIHQGYQRIAILTGPQNQSAHRDRLKGCLEAFGDAGRPVLDRYIKIGLGTKSSGYQLLSELLDSPERPDAILTASVEITTGALLAMRDRGVVIPRDVGVVGFDEFEFASLLSAPLTTVEQQVSEMGTAAVDLLIRRIEEAAESYEPVVIQLESRLIVRSSTLPQQQGLAPGPAWANNSSLTSRS
jgi:LacI family transcriptional regulator